LLVPAGAATAAGDGEGDRLLLGLAAYREHAKRRSVLSGDWQVLPEGG
jgi:hypothetical protein